MTCKARLFSKNGTLNLVLRIFLLHPLSDGQVVSVYYVKTEDSLELETKREQKHYVEIKTFGYFTVLVDHQPIHFRSEKAKELLAILVDYRGAYVSQSAIISRLWENDPVNKLTLARLRKTFKSLVDELKTLGIEYIVESDGGYRRIIPEHVYCDLFQYQTGKPAYTHMFRGLYMMEYSWAEETLFTLEYIRDQNESRD